jgi:hypothetical protein
MDLGLINWKCKVNKFSSGGALQALQSLVSRLQEEMLELHTERDHYQVNDFFFSCTCLASCNATHFLVQFFLVILSLEVCFIHFFHYPTFPCRQ